MPPRVKHARIIIRLRAHPRSPNLRPTCAAACPAHGSCAAGGGVVLEPEPLPPNGSSAPTPSPSPPAGVRVLAESTADAIQPPWRAHPPAEPISSTVVGAPITGVQVRAEAAHGGGDGDGRRRRRRVAEHRELGGGRGARHDRREVHAVDIAHGRARVGHHPVPPKQTADPGVVRSAVRAGAVRAGHLGLLLAGGRRRDASVVLRRREVAFGRQPARGGGVTGSTGQRGGREQRVVAFGLLARFAEAVADRRGGAGARASRSGRSPGERRPCAMRMGWSHLTDIVDMVVSAVAVCVRGSRGRGGFKKGLSRLEIFSNFLPKSAEI